MAAIVPLCNAPSRARSALSHSRYCQPAGRCARGPQTAGDSMLFDDRLATVLRYGAGRETAARTQYRQLLDLLGSMPPGTASVLIDVAYERLGELAEALPATVQSAILRAP